MARAGALEMETTGSSQTVADWCRQSGGLFEADRVWPEPAAPLTTGASVWTERSTPFTLVIGNRQQELRGHGTTVAEALASVGVFLVGRDYSVPEGNAPLLWGQTIAVNRVSERLEIAQETTSFETRWEADPDLELDQTRLAREGQEGVRVIRHKLTLLNEEVADRHFEDAWIQQEPLDRLMAYGTKVVIRQVDTPAGALEYWRKVRVLVTSYSPSTAGPSPSSPYYGITRSGKRATTGMVAVDTSVIPMGTRMYVPGYGVGVAEDTGSAIIGRHIDVCYDDDELIHWRRWVDIYLLAPEPPEWGIRWVLPNWPKER